MWFELIYCNGLSCLIYLIKDSLIYKEGFLYKGVFNGLYCVWVSLFNLFSFKLFFFVDEVRVKFVCCIWLLNGDLFWFLL